MLAVSLQPTPLRWMRKVVPTGPRVTSRGSAVGAIQNEPCFLSFPVATQSVCTPPRSSGVSKRNSVAPAASAAASGNRGEHLPPCRIRGSRGDHARHLLPTPARHTVADHGGPVQLMGFPWLQTRTP